MKLFLLILVVSIILVPVFIFLAQRVVNDDLSQQENIKDQTDENLGDIWFFPKDKARQDGSKITAKEWGSLSKIQKMAF